jgi:hypothetical protein
MPSKCMNTTIERKCPSMQLPSCCLRCWCFSLAPIFVHIDDSSCICSVQTPVLSFVHFQRAGWHRFHRCWCCFQLRCYWHFGKSPIQCCRCCRERHLCRHAVLCCSRLLFVAGSGSGLIEPLLDSQVALAPFCHKPDALGSFWESLTLDIVQVAFKNQKIKPAGERSVQEALDLLKDTYASAGERDIMTGDSVEFMVRFSGPIACCLHFEKLFSFS